MKITPAQVQDATQQVDANGGRERGVFQKLKENFLDNMRDGDEVRKLAYGVGLAGAVAGIYATPIGWGVTAGAGLVAVGSKAAEAYPHMRRAIGRMEHRHSLGLPLLQRPPESAQER
ncbi:MAG: hypothetical protein PW734_09050 [Verrucomicrobium sp.]|nr:hypothetical protein [Verrucomicrobium sp.]